MGTEVMSLLHGGGIEKLFVSRDKSGAWELALRKVVK